MQAMPASAQLTAMTVVQRQLINILQKGKSVIHQEDVKL